MEVDYKKLAIEIIELRNQDLELRNQLIKNKKLSQGYDEEMEKLHTSNAKALDGIIERIGYPTIKKVGEKANEAACLVIQHAIGHPAFMKKCAKLLEKAVQENQASAIGLAYLTDRIAVYEGKSQLYGSQFDWDKNGDLSPQTFDSLEKVNQRRKLIGFNSLEEQTELMRKKAVDENQIAPQNFEIRMKEFNKWKAKVGWLKV